MEGVFLVVLVGLTTLASAHFDGYPFAHVNKGRYGAQYQFANYKKKDAAAQPTARPDYTAGRVAAGSHFGFLPSSVDGQRKMEFDFRKHSGFPVHLGNGQFYFLGAVSGVADSCKKSQDNGFYFTGDRRAYTVCENGRSHTFNCPKGTRNRDATYFRFNKKYGRNDLCSEHDA